MHATAPCSGRRNPALAGFRCQRCATEYPIDDYDHGCPRCARDSFPVNLSAFYRGPATGLQIPYPAVRSLGEGFTPRIDLPGLAAAIRVGRLTLQLEWCNPTGSHKDRMSAQLVQRARDKGSSTIVAASSGNAGLSIASYAALAGVPAEIVATKALTQVFRDAILATGATLTFAADSLARWEILRRKVEGGAFAATNYAMPAVGTNPFGVEGYKTLAAEIAAEGALPDVIVAPTARGDLISGLYLGFVALGGHLPRLVAAEPFPRLSKVLAGADYRGMFEGSTNQFSIAGATTTYQALHAVQQTGGSAVAVDDDAAACAARDLARLGLHAEGAAAAALVAARQLAAADDLRDRHILLVLTGSSFREPRRQLEPRTAIKPKGRTNHADQEALL